MLLTLVLNLVLTLLEMAAALAAICALVGGVIGLPIFPLRNYFARAGTGILMWAAIGGCLSAWRHTIAEAGLGAGAFFFLLLAYAIVFAWATWLWPEKILGFFYSFSRHPAADIVDRYITTNQGFDVPSIKKAFRDIPRDFVMQNVRARQAAALAEKLERESAVAEQHEKAERQLVELRLQRARVERFQEKREGHE